MFFFLFINKKNKLIKGIGGVFQPFTQKRQLTPKFLVIVDLKIPSQHSYNKKLPSPHLCETLPDSNHFNHKPLTLS